MIEEIGKDKEAAIRKILVDKPDPAVVPFVKMLFNLWPNTVLPTIPYDDIFERAKKTLPITNEEATMIAIPITQLKNYYLPVMNPIWLSWANLASAIYGITSIRVQILREFRFAIAERKKQEHPPAQEVCKCALPNANVIIKGICQACKKPLKK